MNIRPSRFLPIAVIAALSVGGAGTALAQEGDCVEECPSGPQAPRIYSEYPQETYLTDALRKGHPFGCGSPADTKRNIPEVDCRIEAKITIPAKAAKYLGLSSRVLAQGVASDRTDHYMDGRQDLGRNYFLKPASSLKAKLKAKKVLGLGVNITGKISVVGADQIYCNDGNALHASCPIDYGKNTTVGWRTPADALVCWPVAPWYVAIKTKWGQMCPKPINA
jgi:hypothetical protein